MKKKIRAEFFSQSNKWPRRIPKLRKITSLTIKHMKKYFKIRFFVCASDGFFPFTDSLKLLSKNGCNVIAQPSGSINDKKIIAFSHKNRLSLYFIKNRLFKH